MSQQNAELLKRISRLVRQNQELITQNEKLNKETDRLQGELENLKEILSDMKRKGAVYEEKELEAPKTLKFKMVTVLYANIHGFSKISADMDGEELMDELDTVLFHFDSILDKYKIHKIKTIGDSYMCAGGIPVKNITNPVQVVLAAIEMQQYLEEYQKKLDEKKRIWQIKMGIHTGPVTAGIIGKKKKAYDIKGDTVNIATRMESAADVGKILLSVMTNELIKEFFVCEYYGKLPVKYKGDLEMFTVKGLKPEFSVNGNGIVPNDLFETKFKLIQFTDIQEIILDKLEKELGCGLAREFLPKYGYNQTQIDKISEIIMATKLPPKPNNLLEAIICDSDLDYLGRSDMIPVSNTLFKELEEQNKITSFNAWNKLQVKFITGHQS